eukprot:758208-Pyramimonas_sp.AAC.2
MRKRCGSRFWVVVRQKGYVGPILCGPVKEGQCGGPRRPLVWPRAGPASWGACTLQIHVGRAVARRPGGRVLL